MDQWAREMTRFMAHVDAARALSFPSPALAPMAAARWQPAVNVYETTDAIVVLAELAGVAPDEMTIQYDAGHLLVWGQRREAVPADTQAVHRLEIQAGRFAFQVRLPAAVDAEAATATLHAGILGVRLPKRPTHRSGIIRLYPAESERRTP
jgi:HSP20 family molecular chaperone IbpA